MRTFIIPAILLLFFIPPVFGEAVYYGKAGLSVELPKGWKPKITDGKLICEYQPKGWQFIIETVSTNGAGFTEDAQFALLEWIFRQRMMTDLTADDRYEEDAAGLSGYAITGTCQPENSPKLTVYCSSLLKKDSYIILILKGNFPNNDEFHQTLYLLLAGMKSLTNP